MGLGESEAAETRLAAAAALVATTRAGGASGSGWAGCAARWPCSPGTREAALGPVQESVDLAEQSGAPRHVAKGLLFHGVALVEAGRPDEAVAVLRRAGLLAESLGTLPLLWPVRAVLGALLAADSPEESEQALESARRAAAAIAEDLPEPLRAGWLGRADVDALLTG